MSLRLLAAHLTRMVEVVREDSRRLKPARERLVARCELYMESFQLDLARYQEQSERRDRITSGKMVSRWVRNDEELSLSVEEVTSRIDVVVTTLQEEANIVAVVTGELGGLEEEDEETGGLVERSERVLAGVKRERPANRQDDTPRQIAQLVVRLLKRRDLRLRALSGLFTRLTECLTSLTDLALAVTLLTKDITTTDTSLYRTQLSRQNHIWTLLTAAVTHKPASDLARLEEEIELNNSVIQENIRVREELKEEN